MTVSEKIDGLMNDLIELMEVRGEFDEAGNKALEARIEAIRENIEELVEIEKVSALVADLHS